MRGVAVLLVVLTHSTVSGYRPWWVWGPLFGGSVGVELFFFISGFVLFLPHAEGRGDGLGRYVAKRFWKIVPSYWLAVLVAVAFFAVRTSPGDVLLHLSFLHPLTRASMYGITPAFWSLGTEVQFYVVFPLVARAMLRARWATFLGALALGEGWRLWLHATGANGDFYAICQLPATVDVFVTGMLCASVHAEREDQPFRPPTVAAVTGAVVCAAALVLFVWAFAWATVRGSYADHQAFQSDWRVVLEFLVAGFTLLALECPGWFQAAVGNPFLVWLAGISYSVYLWHETIVDQCQVTYFPCAAAPHWGGRFASDRFFLGYVAVSLLVGWALTRSFETPLLRFGLALRKGKPA
jgi:peptidoglycan/LPS O-acetylase OafA/YrhL